MKQNNSSSGVQVSLRKLCGNDHDYHFFYSAPLRQFEQLSVDKAHLRLAEGAVQEASLKSMSAPRHFATPCLMSALATTMTTPLSAIIRTPLANTIGRCW